MTLTCTLDSHDSATVALSLSDEQGITNSEEESTEKVTFNTFTSTSDVMIENCIHEASDYLQLRLQVDVISRGLLPNITGNYCCLNQTCFQSLARNGSRTTHLTLLAVNASFSEDCIHDRLNGHDTEKLSNVSCTCAMKATSQDSACVAPVVLYGITGSLLLVIVLLLLVIIMQCAVCLSRKRMNGLTHYGKQ